MEEENIFSNDNISFFSISNDTSSSNSSIIKLKPKNVLPISSYETSDIKLKKHSRKSDTFSPIVSEKSYPSICSPPSPILARKSKFILPVSNYDTFKKDSNKFDPQFARSSTPILKQNKRSDKTEEINMECYETFDYVEPGIIVVHKGQLSPTGNLLPQNFNFDNDVELIPRDIIATQRVSKEVRVPSRERPISLPTISEVTKKNKQINIEPDIILSPLCSSKSSEIINLFEPNEKETTKQSISMDVSPITKKIRLWFDKFQDTSQSIQENSYLQNKKSVDYIRSEQQEPIERASDETQLRKRNSKRQSSNIQRKSSFEPEIIDISKNETKSIELSSFQVSPMRSDDVSASELSFGDPTRDSSIGYVSSTTTLFDIVLNPELNYTIKTSTDVTGNEDYYTVFERRYQKEIEEKERKKHDLHQRIIEEQRERRENFKTFNINKITWTEFGPDKIKFSISPKDIYPSYFSSKRKYTFSIVYNGRFWQIKTFRVPEYEIILNMCKTCDMKDESIEVFLKFVVKVIFRNIKLEKKFKAQREKDYFNGKDIDLNDSDIELFLNQEERKEYKESQEIICKRMM